MKHKKLLVLVTAVGLLGTSAAVGASGMISKVNGMLHKEVVVSVNGKDTSMHPVYIDGKAYLPARDAAAALGFNLNWNSKGKEIELTGQEEEAVEYMKTMGVIVDVSAPEENGSYRIELLGKGNNSWVILIGDKDTILTDSNGKVIAAKDLKAGTRITAEYGPVMAMSFPGQSHAHKIVVESESLVKEDWIQSVEKTADGWQVQFGETKDGVAVPTLTLNAGKETSLMTTQGESVDWTSLKAGTKVRAYYGPMTTKSIPPLSPLHYLVVLSDAEQLSQATVQEYRELGWSNIPEGMGVITKKEDAEVAQFDSQGASIIVAGDDDQMKKKLADLQAINAKLISVTYRTNKDVLVGPLTIVFDPKTKEVIGFFPRR